VLHPSFVGVFIGPGPDRLDRRPKTCQFLDRGPDRSGVGPGPDRTGQNPDQTDSRPVFRQHHNTVSEIRNPETCTCLL